MKTPIFPTTLPFPESVSSKALDQRSGSSIEGQNRFRDRLMEVVTDAEIAWDFSSEQFQLFTTFFNDELSLGRRKFIMSVSGSGGLLERICTIKSTLSVKALPGNAGFSVSASIQYTDAILLT